MTPLRNVLNDYLALRRSLGYKLARPEKLLGQFIVYLDDVGLDTVTAEAAVTWARLPGGSSSWGAYRLSVVRPFATYLRTVDARAEVPPSDVLVWHARRASPYLYTDREIAALMAAADTLRFKLRAATYRTLIGLLAVTGMRVGEAIRLDLGDFDPAAGTLLVRWTKFDKTRELPLHPSTVAALRAYTTRPDRPAPAPTPALFITATGTRLVYCNVHSTFKILRDHAGLRPRSTACRPRIHDLRHSFAVNTVLDAYRSDIDVGRQLSVLSTYLGHVNPAGTYWYLSAAPELLALATERLEQHHRRHP
jgi:integrase/recombinase XerD